MAALRLLVALTLLSLGSTEDPDCTSGFISVSELTNILEVKQQQLTIRDGRSKKQWIVPGLSFTCSGNITNWRVAAKWDNMNPLELQVWRFIGANSYIRVGGTSLDPASENPSGVYVATPSDPIQFQPRDVVGIFQPDKPQLKVKYLDNSGPDSYLLDVGMQLTPPSDFCTDDTDVDIENELPLIAVEISSSNGQSQCTSEGFVRPHIVEYALAEVASLNKEQHLIPHINFTCNGTITKWTVGAKWESQDDRMYFPDLQIWRKSGENTFTKVRNFTMFADSENPSGVYEYVPDPPLEFEEGDVLGIFQPDKPRLKVYYRENVGVTSYHYGTGDSKVPQDSSISLNRNDIMTVVALPFVTVEISVPIMPVPSATPQPTNTAGTPSPTDHVARPIMPVPNATPQPTNTAGTPSPIDHVAPEIPATAAQMTSTGALPSETPANAPASSDHLTPTGTSTSLVPTSTLLPGDTETTQTATSSNAIIGIVIGLVGGVIVVSTVIVVLGVFILWSRNKKIDLPASRHSGVTNPIYGGQDGDGNLVAVRYSQRTESGDNEYSEVPETLTQEYEIPLTSAHTEALYTEPSVPQYEMADFGPGTIKYGIYVPNENQRKAFLGKDCESMYATLQPTHRDRMELEQSFFTESETYWTPASNSSELYSQLAKFQYREIMRNQLKITDHLGSGNFGTVSKGVWYSPYGDKEVAVKTLQQKAVESDKVKFLQEAAIMGQFHHPNVVTLHGVVTVGEPIMIVFELMAYGDLRTFLIRKRPIPGEMVPSNMPQLCLDFCCQITSGMEYLSKKAFVHRDIAARNILVSQERICKISDFGMARDLQDENYYVSHGGQIPVKWTAPEALHFKKYSTASDVWSFGALLYEIWSLGHKPFEGYGNMQIQDLADLIRFGGRVLAESTLAPCEENTLVMRIVGEGFRLPPPPGCPKAIYELMMQCWNPEPSSRPTFTYLLQSLSQPETELLGWSEEDMGVHPQAAVLGAPLEAGKDLYPTVQDKCK